MQESAALSDLDPKELASLDPAFIYFKDDPAWRELVQVVLTLLDQRSRRE